MTGAGGVRGRFADRRGRATRNIPIIHAISPDERSDSEDRYTDDAIVDEMSRTPEGDGKAGENNACMAVLGTYELIEAILAEVDTKTLLFSQRVCKAFRTVIGRSDLLQQALFFKLAKKDGRRFGIDGVNPLLVRHTTVVPEPGARKDHEWDYHDFHPLDRELRITAVHGTQYELQVNFEALFGMGLTAQRYSSDGGWGRHYLSESGSLEKMYPLQTPYTWYEMECGNETPTMRMGEIFDMCCDATFFAHSFTPRGPDSRFARAAPAWWVAEIGRMYGWEGFGHWTDNLTEDEKEEIRREGWMYACDDGTTAPMLL